jgi:hypothetical protein
VLERQVFDDQRQVRPMGAQELEIGPLGEDPGSEFDRLDLGPARAHVLQVGDHEPVLEALQEISCDAHLGRQQVTREVVVRVADDLQMA